MEGDLATWPPDPAVDLGANPLRNVRVYSWIPNLDRFVMNSGLAQDFYRENEMRYEVVDDAGARAAIAAELGKIDMRSRRWMVDQFAQSPFSRTADEVLAAAVPSTRAGVRQQAAAIAGRVKDSGPGEWVTWKTYPPNASSWPMWPPTTCAKAVCEPWRPKPAR